MTLSKVQTYVDALKRGESVDATGLCGRIIRGTSPAAFKSLTDDPTRKVVLILSADGLEKLAGLPDGRDMLEAVGYEPGYIDDKLAAGNKFKLVVWSEATSPARLATWDNVVAAVAVAYADDPQVAEKIRRRLPELKALRTPATAGWTMGDWSRFERDAGYDFAAVDKAGSSDPHFMTKERFLRSAGTIHDVRAFLYFSVYLKQLFAGNGYTYTASGEPGAKESVCPNMEVSALGEHEVLDLMVSTERPDADLGRQRGNDEMALPMCFAPHRTQNIELVNYGDVQRQAQKWTQRYAIKLWPKDAVKVGLLAIDVQIGFCMPTGPLYVGGRSGRGAIDDTRRLTSWVYRNAHRITAIYPTMDTHHVWQIFHPMFWVNDAGEHPGPATMINVADVHTGKWKVNPAVTVALANYRKSYVWFQDYARHYVEKLAASGRYDLTVWPHHTMLGGVDHALVPQFHAATVFHSMVRAQQVGYQIKGNGGLTENYAITGPEILEAQDRSVVGQRNVDLLKQLMDYDHIVIAGQAASHCVAWTIQGILNWINEQDPALARKVKIMRDCMSSVVIPGVVDFTPQAEAAIASFEKAGMGVITSTDPWSSWCK